MMKVKEMKVARVDPLVMILGNKLVVIGGAKTPIIEAFDTNTFAEVTGLADKSASFFHLLSCCTSDVKLENCSFA